MTQKPRALRQFIVAFLTALWIHVILLFGFVLLLVFEVIAAKEIDEEIVEEAQPAESFTEITMSFEDDPIVPEPRPTPQPEAQPTPPAEQFVQTRDDQSGTPMTETKFIGERDTQASSDAAAIAGDERGVALSGREKRKADIKTFDSNFNDGTAASASSGKMEIGEDERGKDDIEKPADNPSESPTMPKAERVPAEELVSKQEAEEFVDIDGVMKKIEDAIAKEEKKPQLEVKPLPKVQVVKKQAASRDGSFRSQTSKTKVRGVLSAQGIGSLDVKNTAVGAYGSRIFREIERQWQIGNIKHRSLIAPGQITLYFVIDQKGNVLRQRQVEMVGASRMQWGIVVSSVLAARIPAMPKKVVSELGGKNLELTMSFSYN